ncbi:MAG: hypothetical protein V1776_05030 [Candidatus Diapherotrites archaeon]
MPSPRLSIEWLRSHLSEADFHSVQLPESGELSIQCKGKGEWSLSLVEPSLSVLEGKVLRLMQTHKTPDLVEGRFERLLSNEELSAFNVLRSQGKITIQKSSPHFDKGIYQIATSDKMSPILSVELNSFIPEKPVEEYSLIRDGFQVLRTEGAAKAASYDLADRIKAGEIKGIKSFDGFYYIVLNSLLQKSTPITLSCIQRHKKVDLASISCETNIPPVLSRIVLEFAKEDGVVIEKQKNIFAFVG